MLFNEFNALVQKQFEVMCATGRLFTSTVSGDTLWDLYLSSFKPEDNPVFRDPNSSSYDCNNDKHFIRRFGNTVALDEANNIITMWDIDVVGTEFELSTQAMSKALKEAPINNVYYEHYDELNFLPYEKTNKTQELYQLGHIKSTKRYTQEEADKFGVVNTTDTYTFHHFHVYLPKQFVIFNSKSIAANLGELKTSHTLFLKGLQIPLDTLEVIRDLFLQESLVKAEVYLDMMHKLIQLKQDYEVATNKVNWAWKVFQDVSFARWVSNLIGTTCTKLTEGEDINKVAKFFNTQEDPLNKFKTTAPITQRQIDNAAQRIEELGYTDSFTRRFATLEDIDINEILHTNSSEKESKVGSKTAALFSKVKSNTGTGLSRHKRAEFDAVDEVSIDQFMSDILPNSSAIHVLVENEFANNFVALTTAENKHCKPLFKWDNPYSFTSKNNLAGISFIKEAVKTAGGNIEGVLRGSLIWNESGTDTSDLDSWMIQPDGQKVGFNTAFRKDTVGKHFSSCGAQLDLDNTNPGTKLGVENIYFQSLDKLKYGTYKFWVNQYSPRNSQGFKYEIEFNGEVYNYEYNQPVRGNVDIANVAWDGKQFTITHHLQPAAAKVNTIWGIDTNQFHKVNLVCLSPNYWGNNAVGNKHFFFMLDKCKPTEPLRSFHIENLNGELLSERKVLEVLGATTMLEPIDKQLAGIGFTKDSTETLIVRVEGSFKLTVKIKF
jgi:hypothetical protein